MIRCSDLIDFIEEIAPRELAEEWDNVGLLVGNRTKPIKKIMLCMDITSASVKKAAEENVDMIVAHHPVIFKELKRVIEGEGKGSILYALIRNDINVYAAHTNLDFAISGVNTHLANVLKIRDAVIYGNGPGKVGYLETKVALDGFIANVKDALEVPFVRVVGSVDKEIEKVAVFCGSFDGDLDAVIQSNADVLVTGDVKYHTALDAKEAGICIIDAGHFNTEKIVMPPLAALIKERFPEAQVFCHQQEEDPFKTC